MSCTGVAESRSIYPGGHRTIPKEYNAGSAPTDAQWGRGTAVFAVFVKMSRVSWLKSRTVKQGSLILEIGKNKIRIDVDESKNLPENIKISK